MNVAMVVYSHYSRDARVRRYAESLSRKNHEVDVISLQEPYEPKEQEIRLWKIPFPRKRLGHYWYLVEYVIFFLSSLFLLSCLQLFKRYRLIHIHNMPDFLVFCTVIPKLFGAKIILDLHDPMPELYQCKYQTTPSSPAVMLLVFLEKLSCRFADYVITANDMFKTVFLSRKSVTEKNMSVILNVPDPHIFSSRKKYKNDRYFTLFYMGTVEERFGLDIAVDSIHGLLTDIPNLRLIIVPKIEYEGMHFKRLREKSEMPQLNDRILIEKPQSLEQIAEKLHEVDVGIVLARRNVFTDRIFPVKLLEFIQMDIPIIATSTPLLKTYFDSRSIAFIPEDDPEAFRTMVNALYKNEKKRVSLVKNARKYLREHNWEKEEKKYLSIVTRLLGARS